MNQQCASEMKLTIISQIKQIFKQENPSLDSEAYQFDVDGTGPFHITIQHKEQQDETITLKTLKLFQFKCTADGNTYEVDFGTPMQKGGRRRKTYKRTRHSSRQTRRNL